MATETSSGARRGAATDQAVSEAEPVEKRDGGAGAPCCGFEAGQTEATVLAADYTASVADTQVAQQTRRIQGETPHINPTTTLALGEHAALAAPAVDVETVARQAVQCVVDRVLSRPEVFARCFVRDLVRKCARRTAWQQQQERQRELREQRYLEELELVMALSMEEEYRRIQAQHRRPTSTTSDPPAAVVDVVEDDESRHVGNVEGEQETSESDSEQLLTHEERSATSGSEDGGDPLRPTTTRDQVFATGSWRSQRVAARSGVRPPVAKVASEEDLDLECFVWPQLELEEGNDECQICFCAYERGDLCAVLNCGGRHVFHKGCVVAWMLRADGCCPICGVRCVLELNSKSRETRTSAPPRTEVRVPQDFEPPRTTSCVQQEALVRVVHEEPVQVEPVRPPPTTSSSTATSSRRTSGTLVHRLMEALACCTVRPQD
mmetsp:Transcript_23393/g.59191  ORF Transcript_23393/g.59191 Transcript_23393/m.59191 type:complete len:436 (-) Transcript_23393:182-1489(-)